MNRKLWLLLAVHVVLGIGFSSSVRAAYHIPASYVPGSIESAVALAYCESCLLGAWAAMSHTPLWKRLFGLCVGQSYLCCLFAILGRSGFLESAIVAALVTFVLCAVRLWRIDLCRITEQSTSEDRMPLQFSIRAMMTLTFAVALGVCSANGLRKMNANLPPNCQDAFFDSMLSVSYAVTGLASLWATLGARPPIARSVAVFFMPPVLDTYVFYTGGRITWFAYSFVLVITFLQTLALLASLLVVRSCGYRLVRRDRNAAAAVSKQTPRSSETGTNQS